jgi:Uma2 family endonuclease
MAANATLVSVDEYLYSSEKPLCEYRDGVLYPKPMPTKLHALLQLLLANLLAGQQLEALPELAVRISPTRYLIPDVVAAPVLGDPYPTEPVLLCCEILSPGDRLSTAFAKCEEYHEWGVPYCWVFDPEKQTAWHYHKGADPEPIRDIVRAGDVQIALVQLFAPKV